MQSPPELAEARNDLAVRAARFGGFALRSADGKRAFVGGSLPGALRARTFIHNIEGDDPAKTRRTLPAGRYGAGLDRTITRLSLHFAT